MKLNLVLPYQTIYEHDLTEDVVDTLKSKRKAKLKEIEMGESAHTETAEGFEKIQLLLLQLHTIHFYNKTKKPTQE